MTNPTGYAWRNAETLSPRPFLCGFCSNRVSSVVGYLAQVNGSNAPHRSMRICPHCARPCYFNEFGEQLPGPLFGSDVAHLPEGVATIYGEARKSASAGAYTGCLGLLRTLLSHIAVEQKATPGDSFKKHIEYLATKGIIPPTFTDWAHLIREAGNAITHDLEIGTKEECEGMFVLTELILQVVYEFPNRFPKKRTP